MINKDEFFAIGQISKPHGLKGELSFITNYAIPADLEITFIVLEPEGLPVPFYIENIRMKSDTSGILKLERIDTDEQARQYIGHIMYLPNIFLDIVENNKPETEYFNGFEIIDSIHCSIGKIIGMEQSTANTLFVVETKTGEILIPAAEEYITEIDHEIKIIRLNLPEGLLDL